MQDVVLAPLAREPSHGYDLRRQLAAALGPLGGTLNAGQVYVTLTRLEKTGLVVLAFAAILGSRTTVDSGYGYTALWLSVAGLGFGFSVVPSMDGALAALPADRAGSGSGLLMTTRQVGGAIGIALLGSLLASTFRDRLSVTGLPAALGHTAGESVVAAHLVARKTGSARLAASADAAYVHGMGLVLLVCGIAALATSLLAAAFLPHTPPDRPTDQEGNEGTAVAPVTADAGQ